LALNRQGPHETLDEQKSEDQGGQKVARQDAEELPDRKRLDVRSDLAAVEGQHDKHEGIVKGDPRHESPRPARRGWTIGMRVEYDSRMKLRMLFLLLFMASSVQAEVVPTSLAGIVLGEDIATIGEKCDMAADLPLSQERHLNEVPLMHYAAPGIRGGSVAYANCGQVGRIVRIKLKFENDSPEFFDDLLRRYRERFGKPLEWRGDPFQTVMAWKWSFSDDQGRKVNLELTHSKDDDFRTGNSVKLTLRSLWEEEAACQERKSGPSQRAMRSPTPPDRIDYNLLIPR
jgi:hypothetical protein